MENKRSVLMVGATGLVGKHCLASLIELNVHQDIHILSRRDINLELPDSHKDRVHVHIVDFEQLGNYQSLFKVDECICCLGTTLKQAGSLTAFQKVDYDYCYEFARLAKESGVGNFLIVTAVNANANSMAYYSKTKGRLQNELKKLAFDRLCFFQPSLLLGDREQFRLGEALFGKVSRVMNTLIPQKMSAYQAIEGKVVGRAMAQLATNPAKIQTERTQFYHYDDMQALSKTTGKADSHS